MVDGTDSATEDRYTASSPMATQPGAAAKGMEASSKLILLFAGCFAAFLMLPPVLGMPFLPYPPISVADVLDLFTPLILIPLYWLLLIRAGVRPLSLGQILVFLVLAALWVEGQGMHLAANSIHHFVTDDSTAGAVANFYDEVLGHYLWHVAAMGLTAMAPVAGARGYGSHWPGTANRSGGAVWVHLFRHGS